MTEDYEQLKFNTAVAQMMILVNAMEKLETINLEDYKILLKLLAPICPFVTEEIWAALPHLTSPYKGEEQNNSAKVQSIHTSTWPTYDENKIIEKTANIAVQVNGKLRDVFQTEANKNDEEVIRLAKETEGYKKWVGEAEAKKIIVVKNKIVNIIL